MHHLLNKEPVSDFSLCLLWTFLSEQLDLLFFCLVTKPHTIVIVVVGQLVDMKKLRVIREVCLGAVPKFRREGERIPSPCFFVSALGSSLQPSKLRLCEKFDNALRAPAAVEGGPETCSQG